MSVLVGNGDGTFQDARTFAVGLSPQSVALGDFNGDGTPDLAIAYGDSVGVLLGNGDGTFQPAQSFATAGSGAQSVAVGDFNGDGVLDLAVTNFVSGSVSVLLGNGDGTFQPAQSFATGSFPNALAVGDFNDDGVPDLAVSLLEAAGVRVLLGNGDGSFQTAPFRYVAGSLPSAVAVGDFNGDGWPDLAVADQGSNDVSILLNDGQWSSAPTGSSLANEHWGRARPVPAVVGLPRSRLPAALAGPLALRPNLPVLAAMPQGRAEAVLPPLPAPLDRRYPPTQADGFAASPRPAPAQSPATLRPSPAGDLVWADWPTLISGEAAGT